jgi:hypothetical protein
VDDSGIPASEPLRPPGSETSANSAPPLLAEASPPRLLASPSPTSTGRQLLLLVLSLCLVSFLADAILSFFGSSLRLFFGGTALSGITGIVALLSFLLSLLVYVLMALTPMIPKRLFLPVTLSNPVAGLVAVPVLIFGGRVQQVDLLLSLIQLVFGLGILLWVHGNLKWRWPMLPENWLGSRRFSWASLSLFFLANLFVLLPATALYLFFCARVAVAHFSEGFVALHLRGLTVEVRKYVRSDGKVVQLVPMSHIGEPSFYKTLSRSFPTNAVILMEGVTDEQNLLTNKISYKRMANSLGLAEQHEEFRPNPQQIVHADLDVDQFSTNTIDCLNVGMLIHSKGLNLETLRVLLQYSPPPDFGERLMVDLLKKRNQRLLDELKQQLSQADVFIVPWGAAHMPGIAQELRKAGFRLQDTCQYQAIRFFSSDKPRKLAKP